MNTIENIINLILTALGLFVEKDNTIICNKKGKQELLICNNNPVLSKLDNDKIAKRKAFIYFNLFYKNIMNCSYLITRRLVLSQLSSKINILLMEIIKSQTKLIINKDRTTQALWLKIYSIIEKQSSCNFLIDIQPKIEYIKVDYKDDNKADYISKHIITCVTFPIFELLQENNTGYLFSIKLADKDIKTLISAFCDIFGEEINNKNGYRFTNKPVFTQNPNKNIIIVADTIEAQPLKLIHTFVFIAKKIDILLKKYSLENQMLNLPITTDMFEQLNNYKSLNENFETKNDFLKEYKVDNQINAQQLNEKLNNEASAKNKSSSKLTNPKNRRYLRREQKITAINHSKMINFDPIISNENILDPTNDSYKSYVSYDPQNPKHIHILSKSRTGKSELEKGMIFYNYLQKKSSIILIDPQGDLGYELYRMIKDKKRVLFIDLYLKKDKVVTINPFILHSTDDLTVSSAAQELANAFELGLNIDGLQIWMQL
jgi:hypothetical protein